MSRKKDKNIRDQESEQHWTFNTMDGCRPSSMHEIGHSKPVHWDIPEGWDGDGGVRGAGQGDKCTPIADSCQCMAKPTTKL